jgi:hypothetical protein
MGDEDVGDFLSQAQLSTTAIITANCFILRMIAPDQLRHHPCLRCDYNQALASRDHKKLPDGARCTLGAGRGRIVSPCQDCDLEMSAGTVPAVASRLSRADGCETDTTDRSGMMSS